MTGREQIAIVKHVPTSVLKKRIKRHRGLPEVVSRLLFIRSLILAIIAGPRMQKRHLKNPPDEQAHRARVL